MRSVKVLAEILGRSIKEHVESCLKAINDRIGVTDDRINELDERVAHIIRTPGPKGDPGKQGDPGPAPDLAAIERYIDEAIALKIAALPKAKDGQDGKDGVSVDVAMIKSYAAGYVADAIKLMDLKDGKDGKDGASVHPDTIALMIREAADKLVGNLPKPKDGKDGRDGFGLEDFEMELAADGRTMHFRFSRGDQDIDHSVRIPSVIYRGVFKEGDEYFRGDMATWGGSVWHCNADGAKSKPDAGTGEWTLAIKRGRDGKDAK